MRSTKRPPNDNAAPTRCPICRAATQPEYKPFCSRRCADVDLHRWLQGGYAVPAIEDEAALDDFDDGAADT